jgi:ABC-2 type transport system ATP-binding protein
LADALLGDPPVLILDEPTAGLDPAQIRATRQLIRELGKEHTILLSTHILPEVEMTCDRVIIIHRGRVVMSSSLGELARKAGEQTVVVADVEGNVDPALVRKLPGVAGVETEPAGNATRLRITTEGAEELSPRLCGLAVECGWKLRELRPQKQTLEEMFVRIIERDEPVEETVAS